MSDQHFPALNCEFVGHHPGERFLSSRYNYFIDRRRLNLRLYLFILFQMNHRLFLLNSSGFKPGDHWVGRFQQTLTGPHTKDEHPQENAEADNTDRPYATAGQFELYLGLPPFLLGCHLTSFPVRSVPIFSGRCQKRFSILSPDTAGFC